MYFLRNGWFPHPQICEPFFPGLDREGLMLTQIVHIAIGQHVVKEDRLAAFGCDGNAIVIAGIDRTRKVRLAPCKVIIEVE